MVWVIVLIWVLVVAAFIIFVLRLARGESANRAFSQSLNDRVRKATRRRGGRKDELPRIAGGRLAFTPNAAQTARESDEQQGKPVRFPVYVNSPSVVEMRALLTSESTDELELWQTNHGQLVTPSIPKDQAIVGEGSTTRPFSTTHHRGQDLSENQETRSGPGQVNEGKAGGAVQADQGRNEPAEITSDVMPAVYPGKIDTEKNQ